MRYLLLIFVSIFLSSQIRGQGYFNRIIPFEFGNPNPLELVDFQESRLVPVIYFSDSLDISTIIEIKPNGNIDYHHYQDFNFTRQSLNTINNNLYAFAKDKSKALDLQIARIDQNWNIGINRNLESEGEYNFVLYSLSLRNNLFNLFGFEDSGVKKFGINKSDKSLNTIWTKYYESDIGYSAPWHLSTSNDSNLFMSYTLRYENEFRSNAYVTKIDTSGEVIWKTEPMELIDGGAAPIHIAELSNDNIIVTYRKDMWDDYDWWCCLVPFTPTFILLDKDGNIMSENILKIDKSENIEFRGLQSGKGDYYFAYGRRQFDTSPPLERNYYGFITKYDNNGDTIWTKLYRHPLYDDDSMLHSVKDIIELDNGDIVAMGDIYPAGQESDIWYFKVNSNGCFSDDNCDDNIQILTHTEEIDKSLTKLTLYPNPCTNYLNIVSKNEIVRVELYGLDGRLQYLSVGEVTKIDVSNFKKGYFILKSYLKSGTVINRKIIIQ